MEFDWIFLNPFHAPGFSGSLYAVKDYYRLNPAFRGESVRDDSALLADFVEAADRHGLSVMMDLVINHTAKDSILAQTRPDWFARNPDGSLHSPGAVDPNDSTLFTEWGDLAEIDYAERPARAEIVAYWQAMVGHYLDLGFRGFRGDAAYKIPAAVWRDVIRAARTRNENAVFFAETLGCRPHEVMALQEAGFDYIFNSSKWWDFQAPWLLDQYGEFRTVAPSVSFPETHDTERLSHDLAQGGVNDPEHIATIYRQRYLFSAIFSTGVMMPMGYEFGFRRRLNVVTTTPADWEDPAFDISGFIAETNLMKAASAVLNQEGPQTREATADPAVVALRRTLDDGTATLSFINTDSAREHAVRTDDRLVPGMREITPGRRDGGAVNGTLHLRPAEIRVFTDQPSTRYDGTGQATRQRASYQEPGV